MLCAALVFAGAFYLSGQVAFDSAQTSRTARHLPGPTPSDLSTNPVTSGGPSFTNPFSTPAPAQPDPPLQQSSWFAQVQEGIRKGEYNISWQDRCVIDSEPGGLHATNRANNLRAYFREDGVQIVERETSDPDWDVRWQFRAWGRKDAMRSVARTEPKSEEHTNRVSYAYPGIEEWFVNTEDGLEHGFTIAQRPPGDGYLTLTGEFTGLAKARNGAQSNTLEFRDDNDDAVLQYSHLIVTDANGTELFAVMRQLGAQTSFTIDDASAYYPTTIAAVDGSEPTSPDAEPRKTKTAPSSDSPLKYLGAPTMTSA